MESNYSILKLHVTVHIMLSLTELEVHTMLLLTNCEVQTGKYLDRSFDVRTERSEVRTKN